MHEIRFSKVSLDGATMERVTAAVRELNRLTGERYAVTRFWLGKVLAFKANELLLVVVSTRTRPGKVTVVGLGENGAPLFPAHVESDFGSVSVVLGARTEMELSRLREILSMSRGNRLKR